jgi:transposase-like protein
MSKKIKSCRYSRAFKNEVLGEVQKENLTVSEASKYYQVPCQTIYKWLKKEGAAPPKMEVYYVSLSKKNEIMKTVEELKKENQELKDALSRLTLKNMCLEELLNAANDDLGIDIKKKIESRQSKKSETKTKKRG